MKTLKKVVFGAGLATLLATPLAVRAETLMTPGEATASAAEHLRRAEAYDKMGYTRFSDRERKLADELRALVANGEAVTPEQANARAIEHRARAESYQRPGYARFVGGELDKAEKYELFAAKAEGLTPDGALAKAGEHRREAERYVTLKLGKFAKRELKQALRYEELAGQLFRTGKFVHCSAAPASS